MRIAISNLAWDVSNDESIVTLLNRYAIDAIDIALGKYFPDIRNATTAEILKVREWWAMRGVAIIGLQSLLFGTTGLNVFGSQTSQNMMLEHLGEVCRIGALLGATRLVFGSPKNRDRSGISDDDALGNAVDFFRRVGDKAFSEGVVVCLEPNPSCYGSNFMMNSVETARIVTAIAHQAIRMQLDTGAMSINDENPEAVIKNYASLIGHVHASEQDLVVLGDGTTDHAMIAALLQAYLPEQIVSIEMLQPKNEPYHDAIERALNFAIGYYGECNYRRE
ncbi:MAG: TIM barrel protein [Chlorobiaceae bacterium]